MILALVFSLSLMNSAPAAPPKYEDLESAKSLGKSLKSAARRKRLKKKSKRQAKRAERRIERRLLRQRRANARAVLKGEALEYFFPLRDEMKGPQWQAYLKARKNYEEGGFVRAYLAQAIMNGFEAKAFPVLVSMFEPIPSFDPKRPQPSYPAKTLPVDYRVGIDTDQGSLSATLSDFSLSRKARRRILDQSEMRLSEWKKDLMYWADSGIISLEDIVIDFDDLTRYFEASGRRSDQYERKLKKSQDDWIIEFNASVRKKREKRKAEEKAWRLEKEKQNDEALSRQSDALRRALIHESKNYRAWALESKKLLEQSKTSWSRQDQDAAFTRELMAEKIERIILTFYENLHSSSGGYGTPVGTRGTSLAAMVIAQEWSGSVMELLEKDRIMKSAMGVKPGRLVGPLHIPPEQDKAFFDAIRKNPASFEGASFFYYVAYRLKEQGKVDDAEIRRVQNLIVLSQMSKTEHPGLLPPSLRKRVRTQVKTDCNFTFVPPEFPAKPATPSSPAASAR